MKIKNKKIKGGRHPLFLCACNKQIDPQQAPAKPCTGRLLYCSTNCSYYQAIAGGKKVA